MPKIYEYFGFIFFFYSNEHEPIHVHVTKGECQIILELIIIDGTLVGIRQRKEKGCVPLNERDAKIAESFIMAYYMRIVDKWMNFFVLKKRVRCTRISKKL